MTYALNKDFDQAIVAAEKATQADPSPMFLVEMYAMVRQPEKARRILSEVLEISKKRYVCSYEIAVIYTYLGETDTAFQWLQKAIDEQSICMVWLRGDPRLDLLRCDPRFKKILQELKFP